MKDKIGFNLVFALLAFPIGITLCKHIDFDNFTFKKPVLDTIYLITFCGLIFLTFKKQEKKSDQ